MQSERPQARNNIEQEDQLALLQVLAEHTTTAPDDPALTAIETLLRQRYGAKLQAIVLYGSYLRGKRDTLLDCYALLDSGKGQQPWGHWLAERLLPPNVYYLSRTELGLDAHAKCATIRSTRLLQAITQADHSYFWSRFAQPCCLLYARDPASRERVAQLRAAAVRRCLLEAADLDDRSSAPAASAQAQAHARWTRLFTHTYRAELRSESPDRARELVAGNAGYFAALSSSSGIVFAPSLPARSVARRWRRRRWLGKSLSLARLIKASLTFSDGLDYLLWKVERHSGVRLTATPRQRRYPLLFAWPLVWRAYRTGGFR